MSPKLVEPIADLEQILASPVDAYEEGLAFFRGEGMVNRTLSRLVEDLTRHDVEYAAVGAIALNLHGYQRFTHDIDLLMTPEGLKSFQEKLVGVGYIAAYPGAKKQFRIADGNVPLEIIVSGEYPGDGLPKPVCFPRPAGNTVVIDGVKTLSVAKLVELKLASGISAPDRQKDLGDVQELIRVKMLDLDFAQMLDRSVRDEYLRLHKGIEQAQAQRLGRRRGHSL